MMKVITGDSFITDRGLIVVCDSYCIDGIIIKPGEHVVYEGKEYILKGAVQSQTIKENWLALIVEA